MPARLRRLDHALFAAVAGRHWPGAERILPRLSHSADHGRLWLALAAGAALSGRPGGRARRAALRGVAALGAASATVNGFAKWSFGRSRPVLDAVPAVRHLRRPPVTTSFPSGHSASAAAFATGVALESRGGGTALAPLAAAVAFSRVYTGAHYPSDVLAGAAIGVGAAVVTRRLLAPRPLPAPSQPTVPAPRLPGGRGLVAVVNPVAGTSESLHVLRTDLPRAEFLVWDRAAGSLEQALDEAARRAADAGGALGVLGGDGTVNTAAPLALRHGVPLAVLPGGTFNHLALDLGIVEPADACRALESGDAVAVDLARFTSGAGPGGRAGGAGHAGHFVNTFSLGVYGELVEVRERWRGRIGAWPAAVLAAAVVLRHARPVELTVNGRRRSVWLLFAGNCAYTSFGGATPRRPDLADGRLDTHIIHGGRWARLRLLLATAVGLPHRSPVHAAARVPWLCITGIPPGTVCAFDGETAPAPTELLLDKEERRLTVYRPLPLG
ncbi:bifunctional phosphatase PAP2/diacylglycerol kinase family protein [Streptomyces sp. WMMC897]|uniref:bifunctional phosphatase PAP2/diacylglycerol kinase family protein n=1 Tax=Streptomyces sp. WMMC897 TaxID=3014782 RepID=UPI0022B5F6DC|nr:bifunctional phosphatase PAP2/diacylglycerol kinase family protein [Streptomyces sp. WMMC897]MCZ7413464.1 phosphatase PAP2 family protein [Streptomyces sp. WMMC897]